MGKKNVTLSAAGALAGLESLVAQVDANAATQAPAEKPKRASRAKPKPTEEKPVVESQDATAAPVAAKKAPKRASKKKEVPPVVEQEVPPTIDAGEKETPETTEILVEQPKPAEPPALVLEQAQPAVEQPKPPKRVFWGRNKLGRLEDRVGSDLNKLFLLTEEDAELEEDAAQARIKENRVAFKSLAVKVQNRATNVMEFIAGKALKLNPTTETVIRLLSRERTLTTGEQGNIFQTLKRTNTEAAARAMGGSTLGMLRALKIVEEAGKGAYKPSPNSTALALLSSRMALSFVDVEELIAEDERVEAEQRAAALAALKIEQNEEPALELEAPTPAPVEVQEEEPSGIRVSPELAAELDSIMAGAAA